MRKNQQNVAISARKLFESDGKTRFCYVIIQHFHIKKRLLVNRDIKPFYLVEITGKM